MLCEFQGEKAVLVDISLVRSDGTVFDGYDELDSNYVFTVRLKLEGLALPLSATVVVLPPWVSFVPALPPCEPRRPWESPPFSAPRDSPLLVVA